VCGFFLPVAYVSRGIFARKIQHIPIAERFEAAFPCMYL